MTSAALGTVGLLPSQDLPPPAPPTVLPPPHTLVAFPASREGLRVVCLPATPPLPWGSRLPASLSAWPLCRPATLPWTPPAAPFQRGAWPPVSPHCRPVAMLKQSDLLKVPASCVKQRQNQARWMQDQHTKINLFLYAWREQSGNEIKTIPCTIASKRKKYLWQFKGKSVKLTL